MAWFFPALQGAGSYIAGGAAILGAHGQAKQGAAELEAAESEALQLEAKAKQERAVSQLAAARARREGKALLSAQRQGLAASGFTADDPTGRLFLKETVGATTLEEMLVLAQGEDAARTDEFAAVQRRKGGSNALAAARLGAVTTAAQGLASWYDRYGSGSSRAPAARPQVTYKIKSG